MYIPRREIARREKWKTYWTIFISRRAQLRSRVMTIAVITFFHVRAPRECHGIYIVIVLAKITRECGSWHACAREQRCSPSRSHPRRAGGGSWRDHRPGYFATAVAHGSRGRRVNKRNCGPELIETPSRCVRARTSIRSTTLGFSRVTSPCLETLNRPA